jgi:hypothetical protein
MHDFFEKKNGEIQFFECIRGKNNLFLNGIKNCKQMKK